MDFQNALNTHTKWKVRICACIEGQETLDPVQVAEDNRCDLGKWIYGDGCKYSSLPEFATLKAEHTAFHKTASEVIRRLNSGDKTGAKAMLNEGTLFSRLSMLVATAIRAFRKLAES